MTNHDFRPDADALRAELAKPIRGEVNPEYVPSEAEVLAGNWWQARNALEVPLNAAYCQRYLDIPYPDYTTPLPEAIQAVRDALDALADHYRNEQEASE